MANRRRNLVGIPVALGMALMLFAAPVDARSNLYCEHEYYGGTRIDCGRDQQPACESTPACDAGFMPTPPGSFSYTVDCPDNYSYQVCVNPDWPWTCTTFTVDIPDETVSNGCFEDVPTCDDCGGNGQPPCPDSPLPCSGCDAGTQYESITGLCLTPATVGALCDVSIGCADGLLCDPDSSQCFTEAQAGDTCGIGLPCAAGLACTLALECAHVPAKEGETCDITNPCGAGLLCAPGIPQRCERAPNIGERCNIIKGCVDGAVCAISDIEAPLCYPDPYLDSISTSQCEAFYSADAAARYDGQNIVLSAGTGSTASILGRAESRGVVYGENGEFGCFSSMCEGIDIIEVSTELFFTSGAYTSFDGVGGRSVSLVIEADGPGSAFNVSYASVTAEDDPDTEIGQERSFGTGIGLDLFPIALGRYECETTLEQVYGDTGGGVFEPPNNFSPGPAPSADRFFGALAFDGVDDLATVQTPELAVTGALTLEAWVRPFTAGQTATVIDYADRYQLGLDQGEWVYRLANASPGMATVRRTGMLPPNATDWAHVALVYEATEVAYESRLYVNGELVYRADESGDIAGASPSGVWAMGGGDGAAFYGAMNHVRVWSEARSPAQLKSTMVTAPDPSAAGLLAAWALDEVRGDMAFDQGPVGIHIALATNGMAQQPMRNGSGFDVLGGALQFDGVDDHVTIDAPEDLEDLVLTDALTLEAWVRPDGSGGSNSGGVILGKEGEYYLARTTTGTLYYALATGSPGWVSVVTPVELEAGAWHHVALTYSANSQQVAIYLDGQLVDIDAASGVLGDHHPTRPQFRIGGRQNDDFSSSNTAFHGAIDEVRVWSRARTPDEISADFDQPLNPEIESELVGFWRFDERQLGVALDFGANDAHALLGLGSVWKSPQRIDASVFADYPRSLLDGVCNSSVCQVDADADGQSDYVDNCLVHANYEQTDADVDGYGNACDADFNNDGIVNFIDMARFSEVLFSDDAIADLNTDGVVNFLDLAIAADFFLSAPGPSATHPE
ncbi:MAG: LamG-like jellyroll fold domain-containing protein [Pseudomonadota bacterium]